MANFNKLLTIILLFLGVYPLSGCTQFKAEAQSYVTKTQQLTQQLTGQKISQTSLKPAPNSPRFGIPIDCNLGENCYIMHYVDRDPSPAEIDFGCGRQTYNNHNGTDFGIADEQAMIKGVSVIAIGKGKVLRIRDGVPDQRVFNQATKKEVEGKECGNGIVIDHGNNWESQYCHLRQGSVVVKPGMNVEKGTVLGMIGQSGLASFPHVHLSLRYQGKIVDPFVGLNDQPGCNVTRQPLWETDLNYVSTGLIRAGFSPQPPNLDEIWEGKYAETILPKNTPALIFWVHDFGVLEGDQETFELIDPQGNLTINHQNTVKKSNRSWLSFTGKKNKNLNSLPLGTWEGKYRLTRGDQVLIEIQRQVTLE